MRIKVINGLNARKRLSDGTDGGFAPLAIGTYQAKPTQDEHLAIEKSDGNLVYLSLTTLEEKIYSREIVLF